MNLEKLYNVSRTTETLNDRIRIYLNTKTTLAESTMSNYEYYFDHAIKDSFLGNMHVSGIRKSDITGFYAYMYREKGYSAGSIKILQKIIHPALQLACDDRIILSNPAKGCTKDYEEAPEKKYALTEEQEEEFLERVCMNPRTKRYYPMYAILLKIGLRISEAVGLTWDDVDMEKREIHVNHQVQYRRVNGELKYYANRPKTSAGDRIIPMTEEVYRLFVEQRAIWFATKKDPAFEVDGYRNFVFVSHMTGRCMMHNSVRRMLRKIVEMNGEREVQLPGISPHILRHTACSRLAEAGCDIKVLQYIMGQTDLRTTMRVYNHLDSKRINREIRRLESVMNCTPDLHQFYTKIEKKA